MQKLILANTLLKTRHGVPILEALFFILVVMHMAYRQKLAKASELVLCSGREAMRPEGRAGIFSVGFFQKPSSSVWLL